MVMRCTWTPPQARLPSCMPSSADLWVAGTSAISSPSGTYRHMHYHSGTTHGPFASGLGLNDRDSVLGQMETTHGRRVLNADEMVSSHAESAGRINLLN